jgi:S1-C subfamily serine protease
MSTEVKDALIDLSAAIEARAQSAKGLVAELWVNGAAVRTGIVWRSDVVIASEQSLPKIESVDVVHAGGTARARLAGRDDGTNVAVFKFETPAMAALPAASLARAGTLALAFGADGAGGVTVHLGAVTSVGPEWHSRGGGRIDQRIHLGVALSPGEEGGPVLDAAGHLLGMSTLGPRRRVLVIPVSTIERVIDPLLAHGCIERGWLGVGVQSVAVPDTLRAAAGQDSGLMVMSAVSDAPAAQAGIAAGDILLQIGSVPISHARKLAAQLGPESVGRQVEVRLIRAGAIVSVGATITARPRNGC